MSLRQTVLLVALLNLAYFGVEFGVAIAIGSVSLFADSVDFLEDASINLLIAVGLGWSAQNRARLGMVLAGVILVPVAATLWTAWQKFSAAGTAAAGAAHAHRCRRLPRELRGRLSPRPFPPSWRQPDPRCLPVGAERRARQCRHRGGGPGSRPLRCQSGRT